MEILEAIQARRSVRDYADRPVDRATVTALIQAAVLAPNAVNYQPWSFVIVQDSALLKSYSDRAKALCRKIMDLSSLPPGLLTMLTDPAFNIFYNAGTLIIICAKPIGQHPDWDCCLAGQNLMLAAVGMGLGTCPIGFAWPLLGEPDVKQELKIPPEFTSVLPIIIGYPTATPPAVPRNDAEILCWK
jgi:nitroreductase